MCSGMPWNISDGKIQIFGKREHPQWKIKIGKIIDSHGDALFRFVSVSFLFCKLALLKQGPLVNNPDSLALASRNSLRSHQMNLYNNTQHRF
jgi:hypothetical protein